MKSYIKIIFLLILVWPKSFFGQTYFNMLYPPETGTWGSGTETIVVTDSAYVMNRWAVKTSTGNPWYGFTILNLSGINKELSDTTYIANTWTAVAGLEKEQNNKYIDVISYKNYIQSLDTYGIIKYDSLGHIVYNNIDSTLYPFIYLTQTLGLPNGLIASVGSIDEVGVTWKSLKVVLIKSDSLGNQLWKKTYSIGPYAEKGESIALCADGGFIIGGSELIVDGPDRFYSPIVIKTDSNGNVQWKKKYGSTEYSNWPAYGITQTQDGGYAFCGGVGVNDDGNSDNKSPWIVKLNNIGTIVWADTTINDSVPPLHINTWFRDIIEVSNGDLVVCGQQYVWIKNKPTTDKHRLLGVLKEVSPTGNPIWVRYFHHPEINDLSGSAHVLYDIDPTPDGGFVAAGYATFTADNVQSTWVIKVDSFGCLVPGCEVVSVPKIEPLIASLKVYPNPTSEILNIEITPSTLRGPQGTLNEFVFELYDILGKQVLIKTLYPYQNSINVGNLPTGVYTYKIGEVWGQVVKY